MRGIQFRSSFNPKMNYSKIPMNQLIFGGRIGIDLQLYNSRTLSQEVFDYFCFKHFNELLMINCRMTKTCCNRTLQHPKNEQ